MSERQRIGEILLLRENIDSQQLMQAIRDQTERPGQRLVSMLIKRSLLDPDEAALALSEQTGFPAALQRHLEARHEDTRALMPAQLARRWVVLPIGRSREGALVVCARDPTPILAAALGHALDTSIKLAVTPAILLERLIVAVYGPLEQPEPEPVTLADAGDVPVAHHEARRARTVSRMFRGRPESGLTQIPRSLEALDATLQEIDHAFSVAAAERQVMVYVATRWRAALLVRIVDGIAIGYRGHGEYLGNVEAFMLPISSPSLIQLACETRNLVLDAPASDIQRRLSDLLGGAQTPIAGPVLVGTAVAAVLVVGDALSGTLREAAADLGKLLDALGAAYERFGHHS